MFVGTFSLCQLLEHTHVSESELAEKNVTVRLMRCYIFNIKIFDFLMNDRSSAYNRFNAFEYDSPM